MSAEPTTHLAPDSTAVSSRGENFYLHALLGAVVTFFTAVIPFSPVLGGAVAGYLHAAGTDRGIRVGAVSGLMASIPLVAIFLIVFTVMSVGSFVTGEVAGPVFVVAIVAIVFLLVALYTVGLSAAGGYLGASYAASRAEKAAAAAVQDSQVDETPVETEVVEGDGDERTTTDDGR